MRAFPVLAVTLGLIVATCVAAPVSAVPNVPTGASDHQLVFDGVTRTYRLYVPASVTKHPTVILVLHGGLGVGKGAIQQGHWDTAADTDGFVVVAPDGRFRSWNAGACCGPAKARNVDDVGFVLAVLDEVMLLVHGNPRRVYATGISNGGMMSYRLACEAADRFAAIAPVAADLVVQPCTPSKPVSVLHIHGLADQNVPFNGGNPTKTFQPNPPTYPPVRDGIELFSRHDGCKGTNVEKFATQTTGQTNSGTYTTETWLRCKKGIAVELITIDGGGHSWPGGDRLAQFLDPPSTALDATALIVKFFQAHPRRR